MQGLASYGSDSEGEGGAVAPAEPTQVAAAAQPAQSSSSGLSIKGSAQGAPTSAASASTSRQAMRSTSSSSPSSRATNGALASSSAPSTSAAAAVAVPTSVAPSSLPTSAARPSTPVSSAVKAGKQRATPPAAGGSAVAVERAQSERIQADDDDDEYAFDADLLCDEYGLKPVLTTGWDLSLEAKLAHFHRLKRDKHVFFNDTLERSKAFRNPRILDKLADVVGMGEHSVGEDGGELGRPGASAHGGDARRANGVGTSREQRQHAAEARQECTNMAPGLWDPLAARRAMSAARLASMQKEKTERREQAQSKRGSRSAIDFASASSSATTATAMARGEGGGESSSSRSAGAPLKRGDAADSSSRGSAKRSRWQ